MKKTLLLLVILCTAASLRSFAQDESTTKIGVGIDVGVVTGAASSAYVATGGFKLKLEVPVAPQFGLTLTTGYTGYISKDGYSSGYYYNSYDGSGSYSSGSIVSFVPVEVGAKIYIAGKFYAEGDLGASFNLGSAGDDYYYPAKKVALIYAPMIGYTIPFGSTRASVNLNLRYEGRVEPNSPFSQVAFGAIFNFGF